MWLTAALHHCTPQIVMCKLWIWLLMECNPFNRIVVRFLYTCCRTVCAIILILFGLFWNLKKKKMGMPSFNLHKPKLKSENRTSLKIRKSEKLRTKSLLMWAFELNKNDCSNGVFNSKLSSKPDTFTFFDRVARAPPLNSTFSFHNAKMASGYRYFTFA